MGCFLLFLSSYVGTSELDGTIDVYAAYAASDSESYLWFDEDERHVLDWVGEKGGGLLLAGELDWINTPEDAFLWESVNRYAALN